MQPWRFFRKRYLGTWLVASILEAHWRQLVNGLGLTEMQEQSLAWNLFGILRNRCEAWAEHDPWWARRLYRDIQNRRAA